MLGVIVVYAVYWFNRAVTVAKDAAHVVQKTGSISDAIAFIAQNQRVPDALRLSAAQHEYLTINERSFISECEESMKRLTNALMEQRIIELNLKDDPSDPVFLKEFKIQHSIAGLRVSKLWCEARGIK